MEQAKISRDENHELSAAFGHEMNKWALEWINMIALDERVGVQQQNDEDVAI